MDQNQEIVSYFYQLVEKLKSTPDHKGNTFHNEYNVSLRYELIMNGVFFRIIFLKGATDFFIIARNKNPVVGIPLTKIQKTLKIKNIERINERIEEYIATFS